MIALCVMGVDPGMSGAIAFYFPTEQRVTVYDMPVIGQLVNGAVIADMIEQMRPDAAVVERVGPMPGQGISSTSKFCRAYGNVLGVIMSQRVPFHLVVPTSWKRHFRLSRDKEQSRELATRLFPQNSADFALVKHDGRAEASLIARYGVEAKLIWVDEPVINHDEGC
jgi:hypothetical protein